MEAFVVQNLFNGGREAQIQAAIELGKLSAKQRHKLVERGILTPLISMLQSGDNIVIEAALSALISLACGSERNKIQIVKSGILSMLLELLHCENKTVVELVIAALLIVSSCTANKIAIMSYGAIPILVEILAREHSDGNDRNGISIQAKIDAISTLHNLSTSGEIIPFIVSSGLVIILLQLAYIHEKSSELVEKAMGLLEYIASSSENALSQTANTVGAIQALVETIEEGTVLCKEHAVGILLQIGQSRKDKYRRLMLRAGVMPGLLQLSVDGTSRAKAMAQELLLLLRECSGCGSGSKQLKNEVVEQIMEEIDAKGENVMESTMTSLVQEMIAKLSA